MKKKRGVNDWSASTTSSDSESETEDESEDEEERDTLTVKAATIVKSELSSYNQFLDYPTEKSQIDFDKIDYSLIIKNIAEMIDTVIKNRPQHEDPTYSEEQSVFYFYEVPGISVHDYLKRMLKYARCSNVCFIIMMHYLRRILHKNPEMRISQNNIHRLLITSLLVATKMNDDVYWDNKYYASVGGVTLKELNELEIAFLFSSKFSFKEGLSMVTYAYHKIMEKDAAFFFGWNNDGFEDEDTSYSDSTFDYEYSGFSDSSNEDF